MVSDIYPPITPFLFISLFEVFMLCSLPNRQHLVCSKLFPWGSQYHLTQVANSLAEGKKLDIFVSLCSPNVGKCSVKLTLLPGAPLELPITLYLSLEQHSFFAVSWSRAFHLKLLQLYPSATKFGWLCLLFKTFFLWSVFSHFPHHTDGSFPFSALTRQMRWSTRFFFSLFSFPPLNPPLSRLTPQALYLQLAGITLHPPPWAPTLLPWEEREENASLDWTLDLYGTCALGPLQVEKYCSKDFTKIIMLIQMILRKKETISVTWIMMYTGSLFTCPLY